MKKSLLLIALAVTALTGSSQVIFDVLTPSNLAGTYDIGYGRSDTWGVDIEDPANAITDTLVLLDPVDDSACTALTNSPDVDGQIAVLYRGACAFSTKVQNAQNAGAVGVVIINHSSGLITPTGGTVGPTLTIPVIVISMEDGAALVDSISAGAVTAYIGPEEGYFGDNLKFGKKDVLRAKQFGNLQAISQDASQFEVEVGAWVYNYGSDDQPNVVLSADINRNGSNVYTEVSAATDILVGDSAYFTLPTFSQASYDNGYYTLTYSAASDSTDEYTFNDTVVTHFMMSDDKYSYATLDSITGLPVPSGGSRLGGTPPPVNSTACVPFMNANASGLGISGITFSAAVNEPDSLAEKLAEVNLYEWTDGWTDINDVAFSNLEGLAFGEHTFTTEEEYENVYVPMDVLIPMVDNQWYLACVTLSGENLFIGYDNDIDYQRNSFQYQMPMFPVGESMPTQAAFAGGSGAGEYTTQAPAILLHFETGVGIAENEVINVTPYPNPASSFISVPLGNLEGNATVNIFDMTGKLISAKTLTIVNNETSKIDVTDISNGTYLFELELDNGKSTTFNVVINK